MPDIDEKALDKSSVLSKVMTAFGYTYCSLVFVAFSAGTFMVFIPQFKLFDGGLLSFGANNEFFNPIFLLILLYNYSQDEISKEELQ